MPSEFKPLSFTELRQAELLWLTHRKEHSVQTRQKHSPTVLVRLSTVPTATNSAVLVIGALNHPGTVIRHQASVGLVGC